MDVPLLFSLLFLILTLISTSMNCEKSSKLLLKRSFQKVHKIPIGFVYCHLKELKEFNDIIEQLNSEIKLNIKSRVELTVKSLRLNSDYNAVSLSLGICNNFMIDDSVYAAVIGDTKCLFNDELNYHHKASSTFESDLSFDNNLIMTSISFTFSYYQIPTFDLTHRESIFSDKVKEKPFPFYLFINKLTFFCLKRLFMALLFVWPLLTSIKQIYGLNYSNTLNGIQ
jgi:hypothetical protein